MHFMTMINSASDLSNNQDEALEAYEKISETFNFRMDILSEDYPDTFAGCYLDENILVIQLTDSKDQEIYLKACDYSPFVRFEIKDYSFEDLKSLETQAYETFHMNIVKSYADVKENVVVLGVPQEEYKLYQKQQSKSSLPIKIIQENAEKIIVENESISTTNITDTLYANGNLMKGGEKIYHTYNTTCSMSICFFGTYQNKPALITCGHSNPVGTNISYNGISLGNVLYQGLKKFNSIRNGVILPTSNGDFSIIDISNHPELISDKVLGQNDVSISTTKSANVIAGLQVSYYGYMSGYGTATIEHTLVTFIILI